MLSPKNMVCLAGIEPATSRLGGERSIQLSYRHIFDNVYIIQYFFIFSKCFQNYDFMVYLYRGILWN
jgi:hypothetical protein